MGAFLRVLPSLASFLLAIPSLVSCSSDSSGPGPDTSRDAGGSDQSLDGDPSADADARDDTSPEAAAEAATPAPVSLIGTAFDLTDPEGMDWCEGPCAPAMVVVVDATNEDIELLWTRTGHADTFHLRAIAAGWLLQAPIKLGSHPAPHAMCPHESWLAAAMFDFRDHDGDGEIDLTITGHEQSSMCADDYDMFDERDVEFTGAPNARRPTVVGTSARIDPSPGIRFDLDAPMAASSTGRAKSNDGSLSILFKPRKEDGVVVGFDTDRVLPVGTSFSLEVQGNDLGNAGAPDPAAFSTLDDFGLLAQDGFESGATDGIYPEPSASGPELLTFFGDSIPPISGSTMLYVRPGQRVLLRLARPQGASHVRMLARPIIDCSMGAFSSVSVNVALVGTTNHGSSLLVVSNPETVNTTHGQVRVGEVQEVVLSLPGVLGDEVLLAIEGNGYMGSGCDLTSALVDDVVVQ